MLEQELNNLRWWIITTILAFFPVLFSIFIGLLFNNFVDTIVMMIGDGELILSSFLVSTPSLIKNYRNKKKNGDMLFILLLLISTLQIGAYVAIKVDEGMGFRPVLLFSQIFTIVSIFVSWRNEKLFEGANK